MAQGITFVVYGIAQTAGSKRAYVPLDRKTKQPFRRPNGGIVVSTVDDNPKGRDWRQSVASAALDSLNGDRGKLLTGALAVVVRFYRPRPKGHFNSRGELNKAGRASVAPTTKPDATKLWRCAEDSLNKVIWSDDSIIVEQHVYKHWGEPARMEIEIREVELAL